MSTMLSMQLVTRQKIRKCQKDERKALKFLIGVRHILFTAGHRTLRE